MREGRRGRRNLTSTGSSSSSSSSSSTGSGANNKKKKKKLEECSTTRVYKRTRTKKEKEERENVDMISHLPDPLLHHIFSFLDTKQAIQTTCLLSKRWRHFWVSLPTLKFTYMGGKGDSTKANRNEFMDFVDRVLMIRGNSNIHEFVLVTDYDCIDVTDRLNTWILVCVLRNVQQLTLHTYFSQKFQFHQCLLTCKSLMKLVLSANCNRVSFSLPDSVTLPRLKTLSLDSVKFEDEYSTNQLFSGCPILESLTLSWCEFHYINVNISSPLLQNLVIENCRIGITLDLEPVDNDNYMSTCCDLKNLCSLVKADINVKARYGWSKKSKAVLYAPHMVNTLRELHNVEDLTLSASFLEVISGDPDLFDRQPTKFCNLRCLKLEGEWHSIDYIHGISYLLKISPNIETLSIELKDCQDLWESATYLLDMQPTQFCNLRCLKMHTLFSRDWIYTIAYLLKICPNTETLSYTLYHEEDYPSDDEMNDMNPYWDEIKSDPAIKRDYWEAGFSLEYLLNHLKCIELRGVMGRINEFEFLEILLKNAILLEKVLIIFQKTYSVDVDEERRRVKFTEKLLTFPRASASVVILFK